MPIAPAFARARAWTIDHGVASCDSSSRFYSLQVSELAIPRALSGGGICALYAALACGIFRRRARTGGRDAGGGHSVPTHSGSRLVFSSVTPRRTDHPEWRLAWTVCEHGFTAIFTLEMVIKLSVLRLDYVRERWHWLDASLVTLALLSSLKFLVWEHPRLFSFS